MSDSGKAVFLSYASQDAEAAKRIADALRAAGVEVWFDQSELRGGDAWDALIRKRIKECALFVPVITLNTNARAEGYFRLEWKLAVDRSHLMADDAPFLFPIVIGDVTDTSARVPDKFREVQWTRLRLDETPQELATRVARLLAGNVGASRDDARGRAQGAPLQNSARWQWWMIFPIIGTIMGLLFAAAPLWKAFQGPSAKRQVQAQAPDPKPQTPILSEARQLAAKARSLIEAIDSTADDFAAAESLIKRALELDATDGEAWAVSSRINSSYLSRGFERSAPRRETARSQAERAVKLAPDLPEAWLALGRAIGMTDAVRAEEALRRGLTLAPENGRLQLGLASIYRQSNRFDEALALYERAATQPEHRALALYDQYLIHFYCRRFAEADRCLRESISVSKSANMVAGLALLDVTWRGDVAQAQRVLADTSAALRGQTRVVLAGVLVNLMAGQPDEALQAFDRLPADYVNDAWYTGPKALLVGLAHFQAGRQEAARIAWESGLAVVRRRLQEAPNDLELHLRLGELLAWTGQAEAALQEARIFNELQRGRATDWTYSSVRIHAALGRVDDALPLLEQLLAAPSSNRWPLTPALLRIDPLWSKLRGDPRFQKLCAEPGGVTRPEAASKVDDKSVAVLAFENRSSEKDSGYFADGVSDELINVLGRVAGLKVVARTSSFAFKGNQAASAQEIARTLGVAHLVEGSVQQVGGKARVIARLIRADTGQQLWGDSFDADVKDILSAQVTTARAIAQAMALRLDSGNRLESLNPEAVQLYLQGRQEWGRRTVEAMRRSEELFMRAIALEPKFARAHSGLVDAWVTLGQNNDFVGLFAERDSAGMRRMVERARLAVALDPDSAEAHATLGSALAQAWQPEEARQALERALELNPNYATAHQWLGRALLVEGRAAEAVASLRRACELDPLSSRQADNLGISLWFVGRGEDGLAEIDRALMLQPDSEQAQAQRAMVLAGLGRCEEAVAQAREVLQRGGVRVMHAVWALAAAGRQEEAARAFDSLPKARALSRRAHALAGLGRWDECLTALQPETMLPATTEFMLFQSVFDPIRNDPRFVAALETLGLREAHARAQAWRAANPPQKVPMKQ